MTGPYPYDEPLPYADPQGAGPVGPAYPGAPTTPQASGINGPNLTPQQVALIQRLAALWNTTGEDEVLARERKDAEAARERSQAIKPQMVSGHYIPMGPLGALSSALGSGVAAYRLNALRKREEDLQRQRASAGRAAYELQGLLPPEPPPKE